MTDCVFCEIVAGHAPSNRIGDAETDTTIAIVPRGPVTLGHLLFIPRKHVADAAADPLITADVFRAAARWGSLRWEPFNLIASKGRESTQSVFHLHVHYVPRREDDGLMVPWGTAWGESPQDPHRCKGMVALERELASVRGVA